MGGKTARPGLEPESAEADERRERIRLAVLKDFVENREDTLRVNPLGAANIMKLDVSLISQEKKSVLCGVAGVRMLLAYYGVNKSPEEIIKEVKIYPDWGTYMPQWGIYLINKGFQAEIITANPKMFMAEDLGKKPEQLAETLSEVFREAKNEKDKRAISHYRDFLRKGGVINVKIPMHKDIEEEIKNKRPILVELTTNFLLGLRRGFNFHFNVITGIDEEYIYVNDPLEDVGEQKYPIQNFMFGMYASSHGSPDEGCLMKVRKL